MARVVVPGTERCARLKDESTEGPFWSRCACGWWRSGAPSKRVAKARWQEHVRYVRASPRRVA